MRLKENENLSFITFLDEGNAERNLWAEVISISNGVVVFRTKNNEFSIPLNRVIKIKKNIEVKDESEPKQ